MMMMRRRRRRTRSLTTLAGTRKTIRVTPYALIIYTLRQKSIPSSRITPPGSYLGKASCKIGASPQTSHLIGLFSVVVDSKPADVESKMELNLVSAHTIMIK